MDFLWDFHGWTIVTEKYYQDSVSSISFLACHPHPPPYIGFLKKIDTWFCSLSVCSLYPYNGDQVQQCQLGVYCPVYRSISAMFLDTLTALVRARAGPGWCARTQFHLCLPARLKVRSGQLDTRHLVQPLVDVSDQ